MSHVEFLPRARGDLARALKHLHEQNPGVAERFLDERDRALRLIADNPRIAPEVRAGLHRQVPRKYRYSIVYRINPAGILVEAIAHHRRRPDRWWVEP